MAKKVKSLIALVLALAMVLSLAACGGAGNGAASGTGAGGTGFSTDDAFDTDAFIASMPGELKGTTIKFLNWYDIEARQAEWDNIKAFEAASGIKVDVIDVEYGAAYSDKLAGLVATGDAPDLIRMSSPKMTWMKTLQPIVNTGYDFSDDAWNGAIKELYSVDGIQYAANLSYTPFILFATVAYHTDTMEEFGFEDPWELWKKGEWTWDKMNEMSSEWVKQGPDYHGLATALYGGMAQTAGKDFVSYDGKQWQMNLYDADLLGYWTKTLEGREARLFVQATNTTFDQTKHKALFAYCDSTGLEASSQYQSKLKKRGVWGVAPTPKHANSEYYLPVTELVAWGVPIGAKNPKAVPYFISWYGNLAKYDIDTFYYNEQAKEVFQAMVVEPNRAMSMSNSIFSFDANPFVWHLFNNGASSQITTFIQQQEYRCQDKLNQWNEILSTGMNKEIK